MPDLTFETASWPRRILALFIDWVVSTLVVIVFVGWEDYLEPGGLAQFAVLGAFVVESALFTWLLGGSFGQLLTRLRVVPADGNLRMLNFFKVLARQVMIALVIPPLVFRPDGRGLHDVLTDTATVDMKSFMTLVERATGGRSRGASR